MVEISDNLYLDFERDAIFTRITSIKDEVISLKKLIADDFFAWMAMHGVDLGNAQKQAEAAVRKLKGHL